MFQVLQGGHEGLLTLNDNFNLGLFLIEGKFKPLLSSHFGINLIKKPAQRRVNG